MQKVRSILKGHSDNAQIPYEKTFWSWCSFATPTYYGVFPSSFV